MLTEEEKKELFRQLNEKRREVSVLRANLNQADDQKESWFSKKESYSKDISDFIKKVKKNKEERNALTELVKKDKKVRTESNSQARSKIEELKSLNKEKTEISKKHEIKGDPSYIKNEMDRLETKIETEVMSFDREKKIMDQIRELKKRYKETKKVSDVWEKINALSRDVDHLKKNARETHLNIQNRATESQKKHEDMIKQSAEIDELKKKEEEAFGKFIEFKKKFNEINEKLKESLLELNRLNETANQHKLEAVKEKKEQEEKFLKDKEDLIEEKIRTGKKLTTEDLLVFQKTFDSKGKSR